MNEELLQLAYNKIQTKASFEQFKNDFSKDENLQKLVYSKLNTQASFDQFKKDALGVNTPIKPKGVTTEQNTASQSASVNGGSLLASGDVRPKGYEGLTKKPKTFLEKAQEAERTRPNTGQEQKINIAEKTVEKKIPQKKVDTLGKKIDTKVKENYYSNTDINSRWTDVNQPDSNEVNNVLNNYPDVDTKGIDLMDFTRFLKNNTRYFEDKNIDNNNKTESEFVKNKYLQDYFKDRSNFLENKLKYTKPEDKNNYNRVVSELNSINDKYEDYVNTYLPEFVKLRDETILKQKENYSKIKNGDLSQYYNDVKNLGERFIKGGTNSILDIIYSGLDKVGAENLADKLRVDRNITEYKSNINTITNAKGSVVNYNNNEYIVTSSGEIIDSDTKTVINSFEDKNTIKQIYDLAKKSDKVKTLYSGRGYANSFSDVAGNLTSQILLTKGVSSVAAKVGLGVNLSTKVGEITSVFGMVGASTYEQTLQELRDAGISDEIAKTEANKIAALTATASAVSSYFMPNANANKVTQGLNTKLLIKESIDVLKKEGKEGLANFLKTKASKIIYNSPDIIKEGGGEFLQEILEGKAQYIANQNANTEIGKQVLQEGFKEGELLDTFILSATAGSLAASLGKAKEGAFGMDIKENFEYLSNIDAANIDKIGNNLVNSGDITQEEFTNLKNQVLNYRNNKSKLPSNIKGKKAVDATQLIAERESLKQQRKNLDEVFHPEIDAKIENINNQLKTVLNQPETIEENAVKEQVAVEENEEEINSEESLKTTLDNGVWGMLTAENPEAKKLSEEENAVRNSEAKKWLEEKGYKPKEIKGKYGNEENSFFVPNLSKQDAIEFARTFNQESVATNEGLVYQDGSFNPRIEGVEVGGNYEDFYSTMKIGDKDVSFQVNYNFDEKINEPNQTTTTEEVTVPNQEGKNTGNDEVLRANIESPAKYKNYKGETVEGVIKLDGQTVTFETPSEKYDLGNIDEIGDSPLSDLGITLSDKVSLTEDGNIEVRGKKYINNYSDAKQAINYDSDGNVVSVNLETESGEKRTFRGQVAEDIAYQITASGFTKAIENNVDIKQEDDFAEFIGGIDNLIKKLDDFTKGTLGAVNIIPSVAKGALKVVKATAIATRDTVTAINAGIDYIKTTDWYKNLTKDEKSEFSKKSKSEIFDNLLTIESPAKYKEVAVSEKSRENMTEDGEGNFVFYHYSPVQFDQLDPSKSGSNKSAITSSTETGAWSSAGGVNYLYTRDGQRERMVKGDYGYEFKVPMDKVYDTDADMNNYGEEAERRYAESHNGAKPNANVKTALITQIASENGYQVTVTSWEGTTRAQTNQRLIPNDTLVMNGTKVVKDFTKKYESNYDKKLASEERYDFNTVRDLTNHLQDKYVKSGKMENVVGMQQGAVVKRIMDADIPEAYKKLYVDLLEKEGMTGALNSIPQDTKDRLKQVTIPDNKTVEKMSTPDKAIKIINKMLDDLDKFSKGTAGINIAIPVAKAALQTVKAAIKAGKSISEAIQAGTDYVKNSSWYKNLNDSDKAEFDSKGLIRSIEETQAKQVAETIVKSETIDNKKSTKATVRENTGQTDTSPKVTTSESKLLKEKFKNLQRGFKEGVKETKQMKRDFIEQVKSSIKGLGSFITEQDAKTILNQVANVNDKNIDKISEVIDNLVSRLENRANKAKVNKLAKMQRKAKVKARTKYGNAGGDINKLIKLPANQIPEAYFDRYFDLMQKLAKGEPVNFNEVAELYSDLKTEIESFIDRKNNATKDKKEPDVDKVNEAKSNLKGKINFAKLSTPKIKLTDFEKRVLKSFFEIPNSYLDQLSLVKLNELNKALDYFISTGYMPNKVLSDFVMKYKSEQTASNIINKVGDIVLKPVLSITGMIDKIKNKGFTSDDFFKNIQNNMLHHIDSTIKGIKGTLFYDNIVHPITSNFNKSDSETNKIGREVAEKLNAASKSEGSGFKVNVRLQMFFRQREFESNPELRGDKVFSLDDHMLSMKENENSLDYTKDDLDLIYQMYDEMKGKSSDEMLNMMTKEEKDLIDYMDKKLKEQEISSRDYNNHLLGETLIYTKDYFPRKASFTDNNADEASEIKARLFGMTGATSVRADSSNQRTANKANPLDFNSVANFMTNIRQSNIEKNLAFPVKQTLMTISNLKKSNDKSMITLANALEKTVKNLIEAQLGKNPYSYDSKGEQLFNKFTRNSVTRMLVDPVRLIYDVIANYPTVYGAFIDKLPAIKKASSNITNEVSNEIYKNISSTQSERVGGTASSDYKNAMTTPISKTSNRKAKVSPIEALVDLYKNNKLSDFSENAGNLYYQIADLPARHLWKYYLSEEFRNITGNEFDGKKYLSDKNYREEVQESLQKAATSADKKTANYFNTGASSEQKLKIQGTKNNFLTRVNNFLRSFTFNENRVFWDSLRGMTGFGNTTFDSKSEAMRAFFVINARGITYSYLGSVIGQYLVDFVTGDDEEEKEMIDKKALKRSIGQHAALIALGNKGMIANFIGMFIGEQINARIVEEEKGKYNPYEDNMFYVPNKKSKYTDFLNNLGAEGAAIKTVVDFGSVVFNIYEKIESGEEVTKEDLVRYKTARHSVSLVSQATGLPIDRLGRLAQKTLDKKYPYEKKNKPKKISDSTWGKY